jgi:RimJ/RimL family protein N-acetyltransferase
MFRNFGAEKITGRPQASNLRCSRLCQALGWRYTGPEFVQDPEPYQAETYEITRSEWSCHQ